MPLAILDCSKIFCCETLLWLLQTQHVRQHVSCMLIVELYGCLIGINNSLITAFIALLRVWSIWSFYPSNIWSRTRHLLATPDMDSYASQRMIPDLP